MEFFNNNTHVNRTPSPSYYYYIVDAIDGEIYFLKKRQMLFSIQDIQLNGCISLGPQEEGKKKNISFYY